MSIRRFSPAASSSAARPAGYAKIQAALSQAMSGNARTARFSAAELKQIVADAKAAGPAVAAELKADLKAALSTGMLCGKQAGWTDATKAIAAAFAGVERAPAGGASEAEVKLSVPQSPTGDVRSAVKSRAADRLLGVATKHKDVAGTGQESAARGDPRITERRSAVATLIANRTGDYTTSLTALGPKIENDIKWLKAAERSAYSIDGGSQQFGWAKSDMSGATKIHKEFKRRIALGDARAKGVAAGTTKAFDVADGSVAGISMIKDAGVRQGALVDALLQFRARTDKADQKEVTASYNRGSTRADEIAPGLIAEQRILLAAADLDTSDLSKVREYALLREVIASHPSSSVNGIFEARNAVGKLFMDGASGYNDKRHAMSWIKEDTAPGATASAYKAIHHNFSRDTPGNIDATISAWVFPHGPEERRGPLFVAVADAYKQAAGGDSQGALAALKDLADVDQATLAPLMARLEGTSDVAHTIGMFIDETSKRPLAADMRDTLRKAVSDLKNPNSWTQRSALNIKPDAAKAHFKDVLEQAAALPDSAQRAEFLEKHLETLTDPVLPSLGQNIEMLSRLYSSTCAEQPSAASLEKDLFRAGDAWGEVADVVAQLRAGQDVGALKELGEARLALRDAVVNAEAGFERHELIKFDAQLSRLTNTELGAAVDRVGKLETDGQRAEALIGVQTALRSAIASGLHALKDDADPAASKGESLPDVLGDVSAALDAGKLDETDYRGLMSRVYVAVARTVQNTRAFVDGRAPDVAEMGAELDPMFLDQFVKQSPLHYATALAEKGMRVGLKEEIGARHVKNVEGMRVLNSVGPVVFSNVVFAENSKELVKLKPPKDAMSVLYGLEEKKMVAVGGLIVDTNDAPGGNSHLNMYAMNNGITVLALPELRTKYAELFKNAANEGGLYVDNSNGEFSMMTVDYAVETGAVKKADLEGLRPGTNRKISYLKSKGLGEGHEKIGYHEAIVSPERKTREVELFIPMNEVAGMGKTCTSFSDLAKLGIHARHLAGEKGTVLALLKSNPKLSAFVPDGSMVTTGRCRALLDEAGIAKDWNDVWKNDPNVGVVDDDNFLQSKFYKDADYRAETRQRLQDLTKDKLTELLITTGADGEKALTPAGERLYAELLDNPALKDSDNWITRSSFTGEDRPGKSGAGQYESFFHLKDPVSRIEGVIGVMESTWMPEPIENNVADEVNLQHIMPAVVVQHCLEPEQSGVMISRDIEHGTRGQVYYQLVKGFGGGVEGGKTEEGTISASGHRVQVQYPGEENGLVPAGSLKQLREIVLETEKYFNEVVEEGRGYAVDMEVAREGGEWKVVQARVIQLDK